MKLEQKITFANQVSLLWIAGVAALLACAIPHLASAQSKKKIPVDIAITDGDIQSLSDKLDAFERGLSGGELGAMNRLLRRAANAPADNPAGTDIKSSFFASGAPQSNTISQRGGIIIQGGLSAQTGPAGTPGGRPAINQLRSALGGDSDPVAIGPKHEDPMPAPDTINALNGKLQNFGGQLSPQEKGIMDWLLQRASEGSYGTPGGRPPTLSQALSRGEPNPPRRWLLRF